MSSVRHLQREINLPKVVQWSKCYQIVSKGLFDRLYSVEKIRAEYGVCRRTTSLDMWVFAVV